MASILTRYYGAFLAGAFGIRGLDDRSDVSHGKWQAAMANKKAIDLWREKRESLKCAEAIAVSEAERFAIRKQIEEADRHISEFEADDRRASQDAVPPDPKGGSVSVAINPGVMDVQIKLNGDLSTFSDEKKRRLFDTIQRLLDLDAPPESEVRRGSVIVTLKGLTPEQAERLRLAYMAGELDEFEAVSCDLIDRGKDTSRKADHPKRRPRPQRERSVDESVEPPSAVEGPYGKFTNTIGQQFQLIPSGTFLMGSPNEDAEAFRDERPQHEVTISEPFLLGAFPVTQQEYQQVMGINPSDFQPGPTCPVECVTWFDAVDYCNRLSEMDGRTPYYVRQDGVATILGGPGYRLPTEAQ